MVSQFRPPLNSICVEFPAGLIDPNESVEETALRELKEETGFLGFNPSFISNISFPNFNDPGLTNSNCVYVKVIVNLDDPINSNPQPSLQDSEFINVHLIPLQSSHCLSNQLLKFVNDFNWKIDSRLSAFSLGMEFT